MNYKQYPKDFIVEEIAEHKILKNGNFKLYTLEKEGLETFSLLEAISKKSKIPLFEIGFAGIKDTQAKTKQYISIPKQYELQGIPGTIITFIGYVQHGIQLGDLTKNKFIITIRNVSKNELEHIKQNTTFIHTGIPNYFDTQRFGSAENNIFIGRLLVEKKYEEAVKQYLTTYIDSETEIRKIDKQNILASWPNCDCKINSYDLRKIIIEYKRTKKWIIAYKFIPSGLRQLYISAYQSHIWNKCITELLQQKTTKEHIKKVTYKQGNFIFPKEKINVPNTFQTISHKIIFQEHEEQIVQKILDDEQLKIEQFNIRQTGNFFKTQERNVLMFPKMFTMEELAGNNNIYTIRLTFTLPKGSYATIVLKQLLEV